MGRWIRSRYKCRLTVEQRHDELAEWLRRWVTRRRRHRTATIARRRHPLHDVTSGHVTTTTTTSRRHGERACARDVKAACTRRNRLYSVRAKTSRSTLRRRLPPRLWVRRPDHFWGQFVDPTETRRPWADATCNRRQTAKLEHRKSAAR